MDRKIGVVTSTYSHYSADEAMDGISKAGFKYVELVTVPGVIDHILPRPEEMENNDVAKILNMCKEYHLEIYCIAAHERLMKEDAVSSFRKVIDISKLLGARYITTSIGEIKTEDDRKRFYKEIKILGEYAATKDIVICLEVHGDWCKNGKVASKIVEKINHSNIRINYDTANTIFYGDTRPEEDLKNALPYVGFMHLKDKIGGYKVWNFPVLGEGEVDFNKIFKLIQDYSGPISVEVELDGKKHPLNEVNNALVKSYNFLKNHGIVD